MIGCPVSAGEIWRRIRLEFTIEVKPADPTEADLYTRWACSVCNFSEAALGRVCARI